MDCSNWSPGMEIDYQNALRGEMGTVYGGMGPYAMGSNVHVGAIMVLNKLGFRMVAECKGSNLEGYDAKLMTLGHVAMVELALYRFRQSDPARRRVSSSAFVYIDDIMQEVNLPAADFHRHLADFASTMKATYMGLGFRTSDSKCTISTAYAQFLNEVYLGGTQIGYGLRAFVHTAAQPFDDMDTAVDVMARVAGGVAGASRCGMTTQRVMACLGFSYAIALRGYCGPLGDVGEKSCPSLAAFWSLTPKALGGLGASGFLAVVSNLTASPLAEAMSRMRFWALADTVGDARKGVVHLLRQPVATASPSQVLLNPMTVRPAQGQRIAEGRRRALVRDALKEYKRSQFVRSLLDVDVQATYNAVAPIVLQPGHPVAYALIQEVAGSTGAKLVDAFVGKFEQSRTVQLLVGAKAVRNAMRLNRRDALASLNKFCQVWARGV